jgi:hypothetical protein
METWEAQFLLAALALREGANGGGRTELITPRAARCMRPWVRREHVVLHVHYGGAGTAGNFWVALVLIATWSLRFFESERARSAPSH